MQTVVHLPARSIDEQPARRLAEIIEESAQLLAASRDSEDAEVREGAIDLAIRSLKAASLALTPARPRRPETLGRVIQGPWGRQSKSS